MSLERLLAESQNQAPHCSDAVTFYWHLWLFFFSFFFFIWFGTSRTLSPVLFLVHTPSHRHASWMPSRPQASDTSVTVGKRYNLTGRPRVLLSKYLSRLRFIYSTLFSFSSEQRNTPTKCNTNIYHLILLFVLSTRVNSAAGWTVQVSPFSNSTTCSIPVLQMFSVCSDWCSCQVCFTHLR